MNWKPDYNSWKDRKRLNAERLMRDVPSDRLRPKDKPTRFFMDNEYVELWYLAKLPRLCTIVLLALLKHCNTETQAAFPSVKRLQKYTGEKNPNSISKALQVLEVYGIILTQKGRMGFGRSNLYAFQDFKHWKPVGDEFTKRIVLSTWDGTYQKPTGDVINSKEKSSQIDTLTNLNKNYPKDLTNQMRSLVNQMSVHKRSPRVAIPGASGNTEVPPWRRPDIRQNLGQNTGIKTDSIAPDNTGEIQAEDTIKIDTIEPDKTGEKRQTESINSDIIQPFKKGEKRDELDEIERKRAEEDDNSIYLPDIRNDDMSAGTAG